MAHSTAMMTASRKVGNSPIPHISMPPSCWSSSALGPHGRPMLPNHEACSTVVRLMMLMPMNACAAMVASSSTRRMGYVGRRGMGSMPISTRANMYPVNRKCTIMNSWPTW